MSPSSPLEVSAAKKADKIAWVAYERGMRNVYSASAPDFKAMRITKFIDDDGVDVGSVRLSDDGIDRDVRSRRRGRTARAGSANPSHDPNGGDRAVWAAQTDGSGAWRLADITGTEAGGGGRGGGPELSPDGKYVVFAKDGQIYRARTARGATAAIDTGGVPFIKEWGRQSSPQWSPDGSKLAFVSTRENHAFIGVYDMKTRKVDFLAPSVDFDGSPTWSADGKQHRVHSAAGHAVRRAGAAGQRRHRQSGAARRRSSRWRGAAAVAAVAAVAVAAVAVVGGGRGGRGGDATRRRPTRRRTVSRGVPRRLHDLVHGRRRRDRARRRSSGTTSRAIASFANINSITWAGDNVVFAASACRTTSGIATTR